MARASSGILLHRISARDVLEVWLAHMGGPFWSGKNRRGWTIPKGENEPGEDRLTTARREFQEEIGTPPPLGDYARLGDFVQPGGKKVTVFAAECDFQPDQVRSNTFSVEWPKGSGLVRSYPEIDAARWFTLSEAREQILTGQLQLLDALEAKLRAEGRSFRPGSAERSEE